jgi:hypothetical protein
MVAFCGNLLVMAVTISLFVATVNFRRTQSDE